MNRILVQTLKIFRDYIVFGIFLKNAILLFVFFLVILYKSAHL